MKARRKSISLRAQLHAALYQLGYEPHELDLDHHPPLALRDYDEVAGDTIPPHDDPRYLVWRPKPEHAVKTFGPGGEKRVTSAGGDLHAIAHARRLSKAQDEFRAAILRKETGEPKPLSKWPTRKFQSRPFKEQRK